MSRYTVELALDVADFYSVVNALRDACGCPECRRIADGLLEQRRAGLRCLDGSHEICASSDSGLPECRCWCAECAELQAARAAKARAHNSEQFERLAAWLEA